MKKMLLAATAVLSAAGAMPASAAVFTTQPGSSATFAAPAGGTTVDFNTGTGVPAGFTLTNVTATGPVRLQTGDTADASLPQFTTDGGRFLAVLAGGSTVLSSAMGFNSVSFFVGSLDTFNTIDLLAVGGAVIGSFTGTQLATGGLLPNGDQASPFSSGRITFNRTGTDPLIGGLRFASGQNSLEVDNVNFQSAVPEPATWAMMLIGFGAVGYSMRKRPAYKIAQAV